MKYTDNQLLDRIGIPTPIETLPKDAMFKRKVDAKYYYTVDGYCKFERKYEATHENDHCCQIYLKKGTNVYPI